MKRGKVVYQKKVMDAAKVVFHLEDYSGRVKRVEGSPDIMREILERQLDADRLQQEKELKEMEYRHIEEMERLKTSDAKMVGRLAELEKLLSEERGRYHDLQSSLKQTVEVSLKKDGYS